MSDITTHTRARYLPWIELQKFLPELSDGEILALKASIRDHGVLENGVAWKIDKDNCLILDGVHRYEYSEGEMDFNVLEGISEDQAFSIGIALNVARRQLSYEQIKTLQETLRRDKEKQRLTALHLRSQGKTQTEVGAIVGVPQRARAKPCQLCGARALGSMVFHKRAWFMRHSMNNFSSSDWGERNLKLLHEFHLIWAQNQSAVTVFRDFCTDHGIRHYVKSGTLKFIEELDF